MKPYTHMSSEGLAAIIAANEGNGATYELSLNHADFEMTIRCLEFAYRNMALVGRLDASTWAGDMIACIAETLGIELI